MKTKTKPETMVRMDYLYRAAHLVNGVRFSKDSMTKSKEQKEQSFQKSSENAKRILSTHLTQLMVGIGRKAVQRASVEVKRTICKGCRNLLVPGKTAKFYYRSKSKMKTKNNKRTEKELKILCKQCSTEKKFPLKKLKTKG